MVEVAVDQQRRAVAGQEDAVQTDQGEPGRELPLQVQVDFLADVLAGHVGRPFGIPAVDRLRRAQEGVRRLDAEGAVQVGAEGQHRDGRVLELAVAAADGRTEALRRDTLDVGQAEEFGLVRGLGVALPAQRDAEQVAVRAAVVVVHQQPDRVAHRAVTLVDLGPERAERDAAREHVAVDADAVVGRVQDQAIADDEGLAAGGEAHRQREGRVEPEPRPIDVRAVVRVLVAEQGVGVGDGGGLGGAGRGDCRSGVPRKSASVRASPWWSRKASPRT